MTRIRSSHAALRLLAASALALPMIANAYNFTKSFSYYADHADVRTVCASFAKSQGLNPQISEQITGKISGRFNKIGARKFLKALNEAYDINYYVQGGDIHFFHAKEMEKAFLTTRSGTARDLMESLRSSGFASTDLPMRLNKQGNMLTVCGPAAYVEQLKTAATAFEAVQTEKIVMRVFPLKHSWAEDITVNRMDKSVVVPGIASILRAMVMGSSVGGSTVTQQKATVEKLGGKGLASVGKEKDAAASRTPDISAHAAGSPVNTGSVSIMADPRVNAVLVSDAAYRMSYYEKVIKDLDRPVELVEIHAAIVDIDADTQVDLGVNLAGSRNGRNNVSGGSMGGATGITGTGVTPNSAQAGLINSAGALLSTIYTHGTDFFMARIKALEEENHARVLGRPSVLTVDNIQATLENTTTYYIQVAGQENVDLFKVEAGTILSVTPHIIRENGETSIKLAVNVQDDQDSPTTGTVGSSVLPPIKQTKINTQAVIKVGQSLLIGGYYYERQEKGDSGVPLLKDIPLLGNLFKTHSKSSKRMERLILLTPRIVRPDVPNVPSHVEDSRFGRLAGQDHYNPYVPTETKTVSKEEQ